jgi:NADPH2:quinone reductase
MAKCQSVRVFSFHLNDGKPEMLKALKSEVFRLLSDGKINPFIFAEFDISDIGKAHALLDSGDFTGSLILAL